MPNQTLSFYNSNAKDAAGSYEAVDFRAVLDRVLEFAPGGAAHLELGCGSGRDAAYYLERGHNVTAVDGSQEMLAEAERYHPELAERLIHHELPGKLPFGNDSFDVVTSIAVIMHLLKTDLLAVFVEIGRVTRTGGIFGYSVNTDRAGLDTQGNYAAPKILDTTEV